MNKHFTYRTVRSQPISYESLERSVQAFDGTYKRNKYHKTFTTDFDDYHTANGQLPDSSLFAIFNVNAQYQFTSLEEPIDALREFTRTIDPDIWQSRFSWGGFEAEHPLTGYNDTKFPDEVEPDVSVDAGWMHFKVGPRFERVPSFGVGFSAHRRSPGMQDKPYRCDLFNRAFEIMGLQEIARARMEKGEMFVSADPPYRISVIIGGDMTGRDPTIFDVCGFTDLDRPWQAAMNVKQHMFKRTEPASYSVRLSPDAYQKHWRTLNSLAHGWEPTIYGRLAKPYPELVADALRDPSAPQRIPLFEWPERRRRPFWGEQYQLDVVNLPDGLHLELHSNYSDEKTILARANVVPGLEFHLIK